MTGLKADSGRWSWPFVAGLQHDHEDKPTGVICFCLPDCSGISVDSMALLSCGIVEGAKFTVSMSVLMYSLRFHRGLNDHVRILQIFAWPDSWQTAVGGLGLL